MKNLFFSSFLMLGASIAFAQMPSPEQIMAENDKDRNGEITREEAQATPLIGFFDQIDTNKDGKITMAELKAMGG